MLLTLSIVWAKFQNSFWIWFALKTDLFKNLKGLRKHDLLIILLWMEQRNLLSCFVRCWYACRLYVFWYFLAISQTVFTISSQLWKKRCEKFLVLNVDSAIDVHVPTVNHLGSNTFFSEVFFFFSSQALDVVCEIRRGHLVNLLSPWISAKKRASIQQQQQFRRLPPTYSANQCYSCDMVLIAHLLHTVNWVQIGFAVVSQLVTLVPRLRQQHSLITRIRRLLNMLP